MKKIGKRERNGFTLVEILAAITLLGILAVIAYISVNRVIQKSKDNHYMAAEEQLELAGQSYAQQNRDVLPKTIGTKEKILLKELVETNYIVPIKDYNDVSCSLEKSYVQVFKYAQNEYSYLAYLDCPSYTSKKIHQDESPNISIKFTKNNDNTSAEATLKLEDSNRLMSYSYIIYRYDKEIKNTGSVPLQNFDIKFTEEIDLREYIPGDLKIIVSATNVFGLTTKISKEISFADTTPPECMINEEDSIAKEWSKEDRTITIGCKDENGSGCTKNIYSKTFTTSMEKGIIEISDEAGNTTECEVSVNIDKDAPTCTVTFEGIKGNGSWYKEQNVTVKLNVGNDISGVLQKGLSTEENPTYNLKEREIQGDTESTKWYGYVIDVVGNVGKCENAVQVDTKVPICTITPSGTKGENNWYISEVTLTLESSDQGPSGIKKYGMNNSSTISYDDKKAKTQGDTKGIIWYGQVEDNAGNKSTVCKSEELKIDTIKPKISFNIEPGTYQNNDGITVESTCTDDTSGVASSSPKTTIPSPTKDEKVTHTCKDNAGNTATIEGTYSVE